jgi:hypothetical protein
MNLTREILNQAIALLPKGPVLIGITTTPRFTQRMREIAQREKEEAERDMKPQAFNAISAQWGVPIYECRKQEANYIPWFDQEAMDAHIKRDGKPLIKGLPEVPPSSFVIRHSSFPS